MRESGYNTANSTNDGESSLQREDVKSQSQPEIDSISGDKSSPTKTSRMVSHKRDLSEQRSFMYCKYLHHPGLSSIQYKKFFHMCRL